MNDLPDKIPPGNKPGRPPIHGLHSGKKAICKVDGRERRGRGRKIFFKGVTEDLGQDLSFSQSCLAEVAFHKFFLLSEAIRLLSAKKDGILKLFFSSNLNTAFNATANSLRLDLRELYGPAGLKKAERKIQPLAERLAALAARSAKKEGDDGQG